MHRFLIICIFLSLSSSLWGATVVSSSEGMDSFKQQAQAKFSHVHAISKACTEFLTSLFLQAKDLTELSSKMGYPNTFSTGSEDLKIIRSALREDIGVWNIILQFVESFYRPSDTGTLLEKLDCLIGRIEMEANKFTKDAIELKAAVENVIKDDIFVTPKGTLKAVKIIENPAKTFMKTLILHITQDEATILTTLLEELLSLMPHPYQTDYQYRPRFAEGTADDEPNVITTIKPPMLHIMFASGYICDIPSNLKPYLAYVPMSKVTPTGVTEMEEVCALKIILPSGVCFTLRNQKPEATRKVIALMDKAYPGKVLPPKLTDLYPTWEKDWDVKGASILHRHAMDREDKAPSILVSSCPIKSKKKSKAPKDPSIISAAAASIGTVTEIATPENLPSVASLEPSVSAASTPHTAMPTLTKLQASTLDNLLNSREITAYKWTSITGLIEALNGHTLYNPTLGLFKFPSGKVIKIYYPAFTKGELNALAIQDFLRGLESVDWSRERLFGLLPTNK